MRLATRLKELFSNLIRRIDVKPEDTFSELIPKVYVGRIEFEEDNAPIRYSGEECCGDCITIDLASGRCHGNFADEPDDICCEIEEADISMFDSIINKYI